MKKFSETILSKANSVLTASKALDYKGIINNDDKAVSQLKAVLEQFYKEDTADNSLDQCESNTLADTDTQNFGTQSALEERYQEIKTVLSKERLDDRLGKVYNSFSNNREMDFKDVPHRRGLPPFDLVLAADYAPLSGLHGIFISANEVKSIILAADAGEQAQWEELKSRCYSNQEEMIEYVTLLSAGFELP